MEDQNLDPNTSETQDDAASSGGADTPQEEESGNSTSETPQAPAVEESQPEPEEEPDPELEESEGDTDAVVKLKGKVKSLKDEIKRYKQAFKTSNEAAASSLSKEDKALVDELAGGDPLMWATTYSRLKAAGKIAGQGTTPKKPKTAPVERSRVSATENKSGPPKDINEARARAAQQLRKLS